MKEDLHINIVVSGEVQAVGFRFYVMDSAIKYSIKGYVKNVEENKVQIEAEGTRSNLISFLEEVKHGPPLAHVTQCETNTTEKLDGFKTFEVC